MTLSANVRKKKPDVSVIVPVYNTGKYVGRCLDSILSQTKQNLEVICVNDGSTDDSLHILSKYAKLDSRVKVIMQENKGLSAARNAGIRAACGRYIYFCDSDDYVSEDMMEYLYNTASKNNLDLVLFNADSFLDPDSAQDVFCVERAKSYESYYNRSGDYEGVQSGKEIFASMHEKGEHRASVCLQFIRALYLRKKHLCFYEGIRHEDNLYTLQVLLGADRVQFVNKNFFHRRVRVGSIMTSQEGYHNFYGYWVTYCEALHFLANTRLDERVNKEVEEEIRHVYLGNSLRIWRKLNKKEKAEFNNKVPMLYRILFDAVAVKCLRNKVGARATSKKTGKKEA